MSSTDGDSGEMSGKVSLRVMRARTSLVKRMSEKEVTRDDQQLINKFARLNASNEEMSSDLATKRRQLLDARDALDELSLNDESVMVSAGETFALLDSDMARDWVEQRVRHLEQEVKRVERREMATREQMTSLKSLLYAKFGESINLESE